MPTFSYNVKKELCTVITDKDRKYSCLYGMLLFCKNFSAGSIIFQTENEQVCGLFRQLAEEVSGGRGITAIAVTERKNGGTLYSVTVPKEQWRREILQRYRVTEDNPERRIRRELIDNNSVFAFVAGAFLSCGSLAEPIKEYHLEFVVPNTEIANDLISMLTEIGIFARFTQRKRQYIVYLKGSESIEDLLTLMGATMSCIELMNVKIYKDVRNKANRIANCDSANIERTLTASERQIADIEYIMQTVGLDSLSPELKNAAEMRLENPDVSLKELGEMFAKPVGRSGANHRLAKLSEIAEQIRESNTRK